ncbi:hypothetical protein [Variovorax sp. RA8]|uniref:hypothetical protein n=1 Tax=Variovorax sp. (strain JCM 16519 / RA8) TaxID=662548 RepID=UPI0013169419|nr:hypothetical protein [Variovorax sp. RA8]VTU36459.1 hypothetical protein RA8CHR_05480 [Variovorax sp. RA8]
MQLLQLSIRKNLAAAVLLSLAAVLPSAHAETDSNALEPPGDGAVVFPNDGTWPAWQDKSPSTSTSTTVEAAPDRSPGGAILNPFSQPAELPAPTPAPAPAPAAVATPPAPGEPDSPTSFALMAIAAGTVLAGFALRRLHAPRRRSA